MRPIVIAGGGHAAFACLNALVQQGLGAQTRLISAEPDLPYRRPPLSKEYLSGRMEMPQLLQRPADWYAGAQVETRLGQPIESVDAGTRQVVLADGERIDYQQLVLATGAKARQLPAKLSKPFTNLHTLRDRADADRLRECLQPGKRLLVIGGGYLGLEVAASANGAGLSVALIEAESRILARVAAAPTAEYFRALHEARGVEIFTGAALAALHGDGERAQEAELADGRRLPFDVLLISIGADPNVDLAESAGLKLGNGIVVNQHCRTSDPHIYACGDCTAFQWRGQSVRLEAVQNAQAQGEVVAANLAGKPQTYKPAPWFWSNQYNAKLQIAGLNTGYTRADRRPEPGDNALSVWYYRDEELLAVDAINAPKVFVAARKVLESG